MVSELPESCMPALALELMVMELTERDPLIMKMLMEYPARVTLTGERVLSRCWRRCSTSDAVEAEPMAKYELAQLIGG
jgi:hypothetical protein